MNWYRPIPKADDYYGLLSLSREDNFFLVNFHKDWYRYQKSTQWREIRVEIDPVGKVGDFPSFQGRDIVFTEKSWSIMQPLIANAVEPLPLFCTDGHQYTLIKIIDLVDCLDYSKSIYEDAVGGFLRVKYYVFKEKMIDNKNIFWLKKAHHPVVSQRFKDTVDKHHLQGIEFRKLCSL